MVHRSRMAGVDVSTQMDRPEHRERQCSRTGCSEAAAVTLTYQYAHAQVWLDQLTDERDPHATNL